MNEWRANRLEEIIVEHTRLALEAIKLPVNGGSTPEEAEAITKRKKEIDEQIEELREERTLLYEV